MTKKSISTIDAWLHDATQRLALEGVDTARLDAEIILAHTINHPRTWLHAHMDEEIDLRHEEIAGARLDLRLDRVPIAYIIGHKEFYGRRFGVNPHVLIPRPESEQLIELLDGTLKQQSLFPSSPTRLVDIGTGSGALGITAKLEHPELDVTLVDNSKQALVQADKNAGALQADIHTLESNLLANYPFTPDIVIANLPYVDESWDRSEETRHEPPEALFATDHGLRLIKRCFDELRSRMRPGGVAIFEADPRQWDDIDTYAKATGFTIGDKQGFAALFYKK